MFFGGLSREDGTYFPVSVTGASRQMFEEGISRYTVYSLRSAVSIADTPDVVFALKTYVDKAKHIHFTLSAVNKTDKEQKIYLASFIEALLRFDQYETFWQRMSKYGYYKGDGTFVLESRNGDSDMLVINRKYTAGCAENISCTTSHLPSPSEAVISPPVPIAPPLRIFPVRLKYHTSPLPADAAPASTTS